MVQGTVAFMTGKPVGDITGLDELDELDIGAVPDALFVAGAPAPFANGPRPGGKTWLLCYCNAVVQGLRVTVDMDDYKYGPRFEDEDYSMDYTISGLVQDLLSDDAPWTAGIWSKRWIRPDLRSSLRGLNTMLTSSLCNYSQA